MKRSKLITMAISIGPVTSKTARDLNVEVYKEAEKATIEKIVEAIVVE